MNREIKFRCWDNERKMFVPDGSIVFNFYGGTNIEVVPNCLEYVGDSCHDGEPQRGRFVVTQFTGLLDSKGVEIYESDLITMTSYNYQHLNNLTWDVRYVPEAMQFKFYCNQGNGREMYEDITGWHSFEVIGNIYERSLNNPSLS